MRSVSSTTSDRRRARRAMAATIARQSDSISAGCKRGHRLDQLGEQFGARRAEHAGPADPVVGEEVDVVAGPRRERRQQQRGIHRPVEPGPARGIGGGRVDADPAGRGAPGVEHDHHPPVAFGPPGADDDVGAARGCAPVDRPHVVTDDILAQRIEFGSLSADQRRQQPVDLAQFGQPRRQVLAGQERRQHPNLARHRLRPLPSRQPQRPDRSGGDHRRALVAAADRSQLGLDVLMLPGGDVDGMDAGLARRRWAARRRGPDRGTAAGRRCGSAARRPPAARAGRSGPGNGRSAICGCWPPARCPRSPRSPA